MQRFRTRFKFNIEYCFELIFNKSNIWHFCLNFQQFSKYLNTFHGFKYQLLFILLNVATWWNTLTTKCSNKNY